MEQLFIKDFKKEAFKILKKYTSLPLNLMISGGSLLDILDNPAYRDLDTSNWSIYYTDERISPDPQYSNMLQSKKFCQHISGHIFPLDRETGRAKIDICMMGIGEDGHIASIQPESVYLLSDEYVVEVDGFPKYPPKRRTVTLKFLNGVGQIYFFVPPTKDGIKKIMCPHPSIVEKLRRPFVVYLYKQDDQI
ncbi:putative 6-phosphogluconolactonase 3, chloroplastic [Dictyocoela roeselum]|nr:putative 6-phosphogluconolactonase 3, chloroplastic [Dictyocoela roeselum]